MKARRCQVGDLALCDVVEIRETEFSEPASNVMSPGTRKKTITVVGIDGDFKIQIYMATPAMLALTEKEKEF